MRIRFLRADQAKVKIYRIVLRQGRVRVTTYTAASDAAPIPKRLQPIVFITKPYELKSQCQPGNWLKSADNDDSRNAAYVMFSWE